MLVGMSVTSESLTFPNTSPGELEARATARSMLRAVVQSVESPGEVLARVNEALVAEIPPSTFVTCFYGILDPESGRLRYANAGHNLPCRRHNGQADELRARGMPLGLMPGMGYEEKEAVLEVGDSALFYSDGLVEAHNPQREMFGVPRLRGLLAEHDEERSLVDLLMEELSSFVGGGLGAGGRHHTPYATTLRILRLNF